MSLAKVVERKNSKVLEDAKKRERVDLIVSMFREYVSSQVAELNKLFPCVVIGEGSSKSICGVSYSHSRTTLSGDKNVIGDYTNNIVLDHCGKCFYIGYGANGAGGSKSIPFDLTMTKPQLKRLFKQVLETLVSMSYSIHSVNEWKKREELKEVIKTHKRILRKDLTSQYLHKNAEVFIAGGTHWYYKFEGKVFETCYGRETFEFIPIQY